MKKPAKPASSKRSSRKPTAMKPRNGNGNGDGDGKMSQGDFILRCIERLHKPDFAGIHTVYSGFNGAFRAYFDGADPVAATQKLAAEGKIVIMPSRGGVVIYKKGEEPNLVPSPSPSSGKENKALAMILA